jgi:hypothetical protein
MTEFMILYKNWRGIGKEIGFMIGPGRRKGISRGLLQEL